MNTSEKDKYKLRFWFERLATLLAREPQNRTELMEMLREAESRQAT